MLLRITKFQKKDQKTLKLKKIEKYISRRRNRNTILRNQETLRMLEE